MGITRLPLNAVSARPESHRDRLLRRGIFKTCGLAVFAPFDDFSVLQRAPEWLPCRLVFGQTLTSLRLSHSITDNQARPITARYRRRENATLTCDIGNIVEHGGPDLSRECAVPDTLEHDESRTRDGIGACVAADWPDEWVEGSVHNQRWQPQFRERLSPVGGSEHCRLLTKFAVGW